MSGSTTNRRVGGGPTATGATPAALTVRYDGHRVALDRLLDAALTAAGYRLIATTTDTLPAGTLTTREYRRASVAAVYRAWRALVLETLRDFGTLPAGAPEPTDALLRAIYRQGAHAAQAAYELASRGW